MVDRLSEIRKASLAKSPRGPVTRKEREGFYGDDGKLGQSVEDNQL